MPRRFLTWVKARCRSMTVRLLLLGLLLVLLGLASRLIILLPYIRTQVTELSASHQLAIAEYVAKDIDAKIGSRMETLGHLARVFPGALLQDPVGAEDWLQDRHDANPAFSNGLAVVPASGSGAVADYPVLPGRRGLTYAGSDWFIKATKERRTVIGRPLRGRINGDPVIVMAAPIFGSTGEVVAVLAGVTALAAPGFLNLLQETRIGETGGFLLISPADNLFVAATDTAKVLTPLPPPGVNPLHDRAMGGYRGTGITVNLHGVEELSAMVSIPSTGWFLVARVPTAEALRSLGDARSFIIRNAVISALTLVVIGGLLIHHLLRPLVSTSRMIHRMATGEIELQPVPMVRRDEVGDLALGFNVLVERLEVATTQKVAAERLRLAEKDRMEVSLRQWMADSSHELRTPITVLRAQIEAIQDGVHAADARTLAVLHRQAMGLARLVDDLHTLARSDIGRLEHHFTPVEPLELLDGVVAGFRDRFAGGGLTIDINPPVGRPLLVSGDAAKLRQVFANLLENTLRYTDPGGGLRISAADSEAEVKLYFDDTAPGVPSEALPHLFDRFFRVDPSRSRERGGSGIGLSVCRSLIEGHGGRIEAADSPLGGLRITIELPRLEEAA